MSSEDKKLQNWLSAAHVDEHPQSFHEAWARAAETPPPRYDRLAVRLGAALACVVIGVVITMSLHNRPIEYAGTNWVAPTDFLLEVPRSDWMTTTPILYEPLDVSLDVEGKDEP